MSSRGGRCECESLGEWLAGWRGTIQISHHKDLSIKLADNCGCEKQDVVYLSQMTFDSSV